MTFESDSEALALLLDKAGYKMTDFILWHPDKNHIETQEEKEAINYLCQDWDYGWSKEEYTRP